MLYATERQCLYCELTTLNAASLKTSVSLVLATERLKL